MSRRRALLDGVARVVVTAACTLAFSPASLAQGIDRSTASGTGLRVLDPATDLAPLDVPSAAPEARPPPTPSSDLLCPAAAVGTILCRTSREVGRGIASWYGPGFHQKRTANGERFDMYALTAAHRTLPFGTHLLVRNEADGKEVEVRVNDRGPHVAGRIVDLSKGAAQALGVFGTGLNNVVISIINPSDGSTIPLPPEEAIASGLKVRPATAAQWPSQEVPNTQQFASKKLSGPKAHTPKHAAMLPCCPSLRPTSPSIEPPHESAPQAKLNRPLPPSSLCLCRAPALPAFVAMLHSTRPSRCAEG